MNTVIRWVLNYLVKNAKIHLFSSHIPIGKQLGGHDVIGVKDSWIVLTITVKDHIIISWCWQTT